ncbi:DNA-binding transcriptional regulator, MarR family [Desulfuromusa kysingii]|uniref:DNA-binding transcriptional regulator, MarR family n=1 Tax=Desulfuromusa kysingii TaxID=37625 RepID=A0A1H4BFZ7_9BACT|nr:MarR family transcriptional regulator [Desulfuromusa kysingii]SEA47135.1 DNA-binding transcriptional regulator, MarR family [Desulfuromusa kysingii]
MEKLTENLQEPTLGQLLAQVSRLIGRHRQLKLASIGLHHAQGMILSLLCRNDGMSQMELGHALHIRPPTATNTLQRMERDGWIMRQRDPADHRLVRVYLSDKAKDFHEEIRLSFHELDQELNSILDAQERETLRACLEKVNDYLTATVVKHVVDEEIR